MIPHYLEAYAGETGDPILLGVAEACLVFVVAHCLVSAAFHQHYPAVLEGANPSAEGEDADDGGEAGETHRVLDIEDQFRLNKIESKPSKKVFQTEIKSQSTCPKILCWRPA